MDMNYDVITFTSSYIYLKTPRVANFADIIKIVTIFIWTTFKDWKKLKELENYALKSNLYLYFFV